LRIAHAYVGARRISCAILLHEANRASFMISLHGKVGAILQKFGHCPLSKVVTVKITSIQGSGRLAFCSATKVLSTIMKMLHNPVLFRYNLHRLPHHLFIYNVLPFKNRQTHTCSRRSLGEQHIPTLLLGLSIIIFKRSGPCHARTASRHRNYICTKQCIDTR
jgi:hypothetical protein